MAVLMQLVLGILLFAGIGKAQIPVPCANAANFTNRECCPPPENVGTNPGPCGMNLTPPRGQCVNISNNMKDMTEPRENWPRFFFTRVCICTSNYSGYDCGECKFGYRGETCNQKYTRERRSTSELSPEEWEKYIEHLREAKNNYTSRYRVFTSPPDYDNLATLQTEPIGVYNLFVWFHHYVAKDNNGNSADEMDYAHEATGFPTWHRLFLLWFEREMQIMTKDDNFTVHYWDWRDPNERRSLFTRDRLGEHDMSNASLTGKLVDNGGWRTVCWYNGSGNVQRPDHRICNPNNDTGPLQRCPNKMTCGAGYEGWPSYEDVETAVSKQEYDSPGYNKHSPQGFRGFMEGFQLVNRCDSSSVRRRDLCTPIEEDMEDGPGLQRFLHNTVHIILGLGSFPDLKVVPYDWRGVMGDVAASANDPIFINHHAMVDCILEKWLQKNIDRVEYPPDPSIRAGHRRDDYIVPFIPLYTHNMMYKRAEELGYTCNLPDQPTTPTTTTTTRATTAEPDSAKPVTALYSVVVLAIVGSAIIL